MKLSNKVAMISGLGCLALIGTGFAAWTFNQNANATKDLVANVAASTNSGEVSIATSALKVEFDQADSVDGVHTGKAVWSGSLTATYSGDTKESGLTLSYKATITDEASAYVTFADSAKVSSTLTWVSGSEIEPASVSALGLVFNQAKAPQNQSEYDVFKANVAALGNIITFSFDAIVAA